MPRLNFELGLGLAWACGPPLVPWASLVSWHVFNVAVCKCVSGVSAAILPIWDYNAVGPICTVQPSMEPTAISFVTMVASETALLVSIAPVKSDAGQRNSQRRWRYFSEPSRWGPTVLKGLPKCI